MTSPHPDALAAADAIAEALPSPDVVPERGWSQALADGAAGIALLHVERARSGRGDWGAAHAYLKVATSGTVTAAANAGLFFGVPTLAYIVQAAAGQSARYRRALTSLSEATIAVTRVRVTAAYARMGRAERPVMKEFDLVRGLAGLGACHLVLHAEHEITTDVLRCLVRLTEPPDHTDELPPWWTDVSPNGKADPQYPGGHGNFGMSHGISAVLALLSLALLRDLPVPGGDEAIRRICAWTDQWRQRATAGTWWPGFITTDQVRARCIDPALRPRPSWCYGIAGIARAQQLAGLALQDTARQRVAENSILGALRDRAQVEQLHEIGLCHGTAGLLQAAWRMAADADSGEIDAEIPRLAARLTEQLSGQSVPGRGLMEGVAGAALALHTIGTGSVRAAGWDAFLLLS